MSTESGGLDATMRDTFGWYSVAKKEFTDAIRSKGLWVLSLVFTILFAMPAVWIWWQQRGSDQQVSQAGEQFGQFLIQQVYLTTVTLLVTIVVIFAGYAAITKEKESGSLKLLLSLPFSRRDMIVGKILGRSAVVAVPVTIGFLRTAAFLTLTPFSFELGTIFWFMVFTLALVVVVISIAVSISGAVSKSIYSLAINAILYIYFNFGWNSLANGLGNVLSNRLGVGESLQLQVVLFVKLLNPMQAFKTLTDSMLTSESGSALIARYGMFNARQQGDQAMGSLCGDVLNGNATTVQRGLLGNQTVCQPLDGASVPFYFSDFAVFFYLLAWIGVAAAISYYTFDKVDL